MNERLTKHALGDLLVSVGLVDENAINDPEGFDRGKTIAANCAGNVSCFSNFRHVLDGQWVALVEAADDRHMRLVPAGSEKRSIPDEVQEWIDHMDLHLTEHDERHAGLALRAAWPAVRAHFLGGDEATVHQLICPRCQVDRLKAKCPEMRPGLCPMVGDPHSPSAAPHTP